MKCINYLLITKRNVKFITHIIIWGLECTRENTSFAHVADFFSFLLFYFIQHYCCNQHYFCPYGSGVKVPSGMSYYPIPPAGHFVFRNTNFLAAIHRSEAIICTGSKHNDGAVVPQWTFPFWDWLHSHHSHGSHGCLACSSLEKIFCQALLIQYWWRTPETILERSNFKKGCIKKLFQIRI